MSNLFCMKVWFFGTNSYIFTGQFSCFNYSIFCFPLNVIDLILINSVEHLGVRVLLRQNFYRIGPTYLTY